MRLMCGCRSSAELERAKVVVVVCPAAAPIYVLSLMAMYGVHVNNRYKSVEGHWECCTVGQLNVPVLTPSAPLRVIPGMPTVTVPGIEAGFSAFRAQLIFGLVIS